MKRLLLMLILSPILSFSQVDPNTVKKDSVVTETIKLKENEIPIRNDRGIQEIDIVINDVLNIPFILDTGASESSMPLHVLNTLIKTHTIFRSDRLEDKTYIIADGSTTKARRIIIRKIQIGKHIIENVPFSISDDVNSPLLLGQNVLSLFNEVKIDYRRSTLTLISE